MSAKGNQTRSAPFQGIDAYKAAELVMRVTANPRFRAEYLRNPIEVVEREFCGRKLTPEQKKAVEDCCKLIKECYPEGEAEQGEGNLD